MDISLFTSRTCTKPQTADDVNRIAQKWYPEVGPSSFQHAESKDIPGTTVVSKEDVDDFALRFMGKASAESLGAAMGNVLDTIKYYTGLGSEGRKYDHFLDDLAASCKAP